MTKVIAYFIYSSTFSPYLKWLLEIITGETVNNHSPYALSDVGWLSKNGGSLKNEFETVNRTIYFRAGS